MQEFKDSDMCSQINIELYENGNNKFKPTYYRQRPRRSKFLKKKLLFKELLLRRGTFT